MVAGLLGTALGIEREIRQKAAGIRTNALIACGSALFTILGSELSRSGGDPTRVASTIVTGIGFLGAGAILRTGGTVHGLTTAATIWVNAAIGIAAGSGAYGLAAAATALTLAVLWLVGIVERHIEARVARSRHTSP